MVNTPLQDIKEGIESYLQRCPGVTIVGEPMVKNTIPLSLYARFNLLRVIEYHVAPKDEGYYHLAPLNNFLRSLTPDDEYLKIHFPPETKCGTEDFRMVKKKPRIEDYLTVGMVVLAGKRDNQRTIVPFARGEIVILPDGEPRRISADKGDSFDADSVAHMGLIMVFPHVALAKRSYEISGLSGRPLDTILLKDLNDVRREYNPSFFQRLLRTNGI